MVYAGGAISGSHFNPCVTMGVYLRGWVDNPQLMRVHDCFFYIGTQILGAFSGGACAVYVAGGADRIASPAVNLDDYSLFEAVVAEFLFSFLLVVTVLSVATNQKVSGNSYFGLAIGFTITAGIIAVGAISGAAFNPAIGIALPAISRNQESDIWVFIVGDMLGAVAAAALYVFWFHIEGDASAQSRTHIKLHTDDYTSADSENISMRTGLLSDSESKM
jgi:aquaporin Z